MEQLFIQLALYRQSRMMVSCIWLWKRFGKKPNSSLWSSKFLFSDQNGWVKSINARNWITHFLMFFKIYQISFLSFFLTVVSLYLQWIILLRIKRWHKFLNKFFCSLTYLYMIAVPPTEYFAISFWCFALNSFR